jgi:hypothetical protein
MDAHSQMRGTACMAQDIAGSRFECSPRTFSQRCATNLARQINRDADRCILNRKRSLILERQKMRNLLRPSTNPASWPLR